VKHGLTDRRTDSRTDRHTPGQPDRDCERRRSLHRLRSLKLTDFGINQNPVYDFLLVNNILTYILSRTVFLQLSRTISQIIAFDRGGGCLSLTHSFSVVFANIAINYTLPKTILWTSFLLRTVWFSIFNQFDAVGFEIRRLQCNNAK